MNHPVLYPPPRDVLIYITVEKCDLPHARGNRRVGKMAPLQRFYLMADRE
jgi:hypothetical protein